ncbi:putative uncharacterized protein [Methylocaldum marinum]|uniref:Uncharacterized protein n=1 Tax=Methylocaldum marinum TaxID=1432792 RepID=A0A250KZ59_9GAMM|nr:putative uncharacterized protein [Methylocaldum marinum]
MLAATLNPVAAKPAPIPPCHAANITATKKTDSGGGSSKELSAKINAATQTVAPSATEYPFPSNCLTSTPFLPSS